MEVYFHIFQGHLEVVKHLLDYNASVFLTDVEKRSPLHWAALGGHADVCDFLISKGKISSVIFFSVLGIPLKNFYCDAFLYFLFIYTGLFGVSDIFLSLLAMSDKLDFTVILKFF